MGIILQSLVVSSNVGFWCVSNEPYGTASSTVTFPFDPSTRTRWPSFKRVVAWLTPTTAGPDVNYFYDAAGRLTTARYGSASTSLTYDLAGRKTTMTDPDMGYWTYSYDALGNLTGQTDARSCITSLTYDGLNRLTNKSYTGTCSTTPAVSYTYDAGTNGKGRRTGMSTPSSISTTWTYDTRGRVTGEARMIGTDSFTTGWTYNQADQVTSMIYPDGEVLANTYLPQMTLDTMIGTISGVNTTYVSDSKYDAAGRMTQIILGSNAIRTNYNYSGWTTNNGRLVTCPHSLYHLIS